jgi:thiamine biosynthesis lipoprotein
MGTVIEVEVSARDRETAVGASQAAIDAVEAVDRRLSTWREPSELSRLNRAAPGTLITISPELEADLRIARYWWMETKGLFDPGVASLVTAWDLRGGGRLPSSSEMVSARAASGFEHVVIQPGFAGRSVAGFGVEEGGFGKGIALRDAAESALEARASCVVIDLGGQVMVSGACGTRGIDIAHPRQRHDVMARLHLRSGSTATSGNSERGVMVNGVSYGHLLDPTTGRPAADWGAVTVVASDPVAADCLATALFVMGPRRGAEWLRDQPGIEAVFAETDDESMIITATPGLRGRLVVFEETPRYLPPLLGVDEADERKNLEIAGGTPAHQIKKG